MHEGPPRGHCQEGSNHLNKRTICIALAVAATLAVAPWAPAQPRKAAPKKPAKTATSGAENGLYGVYLYDSAMKLIQKFGSPDDIEPLSIGGAAVGPAGGMGGRGGVGPMGPMGGPMGPMMGPPGMGGPQAGPGMMSPPGGGGAGRLDEPDFQIGDWLGDTLNARQMGAGGRQGGGMPGGMPPGYSGGPGFGPGGPGGMPSIGPAGAGTKGPGAAGGPSAGPGMMGPPGMGGFGPMGPMGGPMGPMGGAPAGGGAGFGNQATTRVVNTRWVYKRNGTRLGFIIDKFNRIVQIEAIGLSNPAVRTKRGVTFGATFADIIKKYGAPDAYEIGGNTLVMRYLVKHKVAFRLNRLGVDKPHQVTGIVVAAGKS